MKKNLDELERGLSNTKKYFDYDDAEYRGIKDVKDLSNLLNDEDYYEQIITKGAFNNNCIQYESRGNKDKILTVNEYLDIIRPYLTNMINNHKTQEKKWRIHSVSKIIEPTTQGEFKIQLTMKINFISSKLDFNETRIMHTQMGSETDEVIEELFKSLLQRYQ